MDVRPTHAWPLLIALSLGCSTTPSPEDAGPLPSDSGTLDPTDADSADAGPDMTDGGPDAGGSPAFTYVGRERVESCPLRASACANWPSTGSVYRYESRELYGDRTHTRTFYVYVPEALPDGAAMWIQLHGGFGSGARMMADFGATPLSTGEPTPWWKNTDTCQFDPYADPMTFRGDDGTECVPARETAQSTESFLMVYPEGTVDADGPGRHWEDGRVPSPGQGVIEQSRDDVGFVAHIVATLTEETDAFAVDPARVYLTGLSNGGMMTQRVLCSLGDPAYPELERIAAFGVAIASMPEALAFGLDGRTRCPQSWPAPVPVHYMVGDGIDTFGGIVSGDGRVPWGEPGEVYQQDSPGGGRVLGVPDSLARLRSRLETSAGAPSTESSSEVGFFSTRRVFEVAGEPAVLEFMETDGGHHNVMSTRFDFSATAQQWAFLSQYRRGEAGLERNAPLITGVY